MSARTEAIAFRIWQFCEPREWDCTLREIADALEVSLGTVRSTCTARKWHHRLRKTSPAAEVGRKALWQDIRSQTDNDLDGGGYPRIIRELTM